MFKLFLRIVVPLLVIGSIFFYFAQGIDKVSVEGFAFTGLSNVSLKGFTMDGTLNINNPSRLPVPVQSVTYDIILNETAEKISSGTLPAFVLAPGSSNVPFHEHIAWAPTASLALQLAFEDHIYATVKGHVRVAIPLLNQYDIPFQKQIDLKDYLRQSGKSQQTGTSGLPQTPVSTPSVPSAGGPNSSDGGLLAGIASAFS
jgi:LEA14-like dessication related protein